MGKRVHDEKVKEKPLKEKRRLSEPKFFKVCPKCGSTKVTISKAKPQEGLPSQYKCGKCGYASYFFPETTKERLKKHAKKVYRLRIGSSKKSGKKGKRKQK